MGVVSGAYYYLVASLPSLSFEKPAFFSYEEFLENCRRLVQAEDFNILTKAVLSWDEIPSPHSALEKLARFNRALKNEIVLLRAKKLKKDPLGYVGADQYLEGQSISVINQAVNEQDPLKAEKILDRHRWNYYEQISQNHYFDIEVLIVYGLKLQILERHRIFASEKGWENFQSYQESEAFKELLASF